MTETSNTTASLRSLIPRIFSRAQPAGAVDLLIKTVRLHHPKADIPLVEVHISNPHAREQFRHTSVISGIATGVIAGFGFDSYLLALGAIGRMSR